MYTSATLALAATALFGTLLVTPTMAQTAVPASHWTAVQPDVYQGPHGHYNSLSDFTRDVDGTPCGVNCTARAQLRWQRAM